MLSRRCFFSTTTVLALGASFSSSLQASSVSPCEPRRDEMWLVDTHGVGCNDWSIENPNGWQVQLRDERDCWQSSSLSDFYGSLSEGKKTVVFVHGNRNDRTWAMRNGRSVYDAIVRAAPHAEPFRFVIYAWPADQIRGAVRDARYKTEVANGETFRFARWLSHFPASQAVGLVSFSLGGRVVAGGLHYLAGGSLYGKALSAAERPALRSVCIAPAFDEHWLSPSQCYGQTMVALDHMRVFYNSCDPVLKRYRKLDRGGHAEALGYAGIRGHLGAAKPRYCESDASRYVGKTHELKAYLGHHYIAHELRKYLLWEQVS